MLQDKWYIHAFKGYVFISPNEGFRDGNGIALFMLALWWEFKHISNTNQ